MPSIFTCKVLGTLNVYLSRILTITRCQLQTSISHFESELAALKSRLETQELETQKANSKFEFSVSENEKLKKNFESEKKTWADEKASLVTGAETAEASLAEATTELSDLKRQISQMVSAIFGKLSCKTSTLVTLQ